jgi:hypothetical protein
MAFKMIRMPKLDPMIMTSFNKSVLALHLSSFANEREMLSTLFDQVRIWLEKGQLTCAHARDGQCSQFDPIRYDCWLDCNHNNKYRERAWQIDPDI